MLEKYYILNNQVEIMFKELAKEALALLGLSVGIFFGLAFLWSALAILGVLVLASMFLLMRFNVSHIKKMLSCGRTLHSIIFLILIILTVSITTFLAWLIAGPKSL